jgi:hypothetical protein
MRDILIVGETRMTRLATIAAVALAVVGCINVPKKIDINVNTGGDGGSSSDQRREESGYRQVPYVPSSSSDQPDAPAYTQVPSVPSSSSSSSSGWRGLAAGVAGQVFLDSDHGVLFYAYDTLAYPGRPVDLAARVTRAENMKGMAGVEVTFILGSTVIGRAQTDGSGLASLAWTPPAAGTYQLSAHISALPSGAPHDVLEVVAAPLLVSAQPPNAKIVVIDLDHTVVDAGFFRVLVGDPSPMADAVRVTDRLAGTYAIVYLTHRPDLLTRKSKEWLTRHAFPRGPLLVSELEQAFGDSGKFKTARLKDLKNAYANVAIGIGDKLSDAQAYVDNGLTAYLIPNYKDKPKDMRKLAGEIRGLNGRGRLNVVDGWAEIQAGVFGGDKYPPGAYADRLAKRADELQRDQDRRRRDNEDDDDD